VIQGLRREAIDESGLFLAEGNSVARLAPLLPTNTRGEPSMDDRRVVSWIMLVLKSGGRWVDVPVAYRPRKILCNRFVRLAAKGVWANIFVLWHRPGVIPLTS